MSSCQNCRSCDFPEGSRIACPMRTVIGRTASIEKNATWEQVKTKGRMIFDEGGVLSVEDMGGGAWYCQVDSSVAGSNGKPYAPNELPTIGAVYDVIIAAGGWEGESGSPKNVGGWIRWCGCTCPWYVYRCEPDGRWHDRICSHIYAAVLAINKENRLPNGFQGDRGASMKHADMKHIGRKVGVGTVKKMDPQEFAQRYCDWWRKIESAWIFGDEMPVDNYWEAESQGGDLLLKVDEKASDWAEDFYYFVKQYQGDDIISTFYRNETTCVAFYATAQEMAGKRASRTAYTNTWGTESIEVWEVEQELIDGKRFDVSVEWEDTDTLEQEKLNNDNWDKLDSEYYAYPYMGVLGTMTTRFDDCDVVMKIDLHIEEGQPFFEWASLSYGMPDGTTVIREDEEFGLSESYIRNVLQDFSSHDDWAGVAWMKELSEALDEDTDLIHGIAEGIAQYYNYISIMSASKKAYLEPSEWEDIGDSFYCPSNLDYENELEFNVYEDGGRWHAEVWEMDGYSTGEGEWFDTEEEAKAWCEQFSEEVSEGIRENPRFASKTSTVTDRSEGSVTLSLSGYTWDGELGEYNDSHSFVAEFWRSGDEWVCDVEYAYCDDYGYVTDMGGRGSDTDPITALKDACWDADIEPSQRTIEEVGNEIGTMRGATRKKAQYGEPDAYILQWTLAPQAGYHEERFDTYYELTDFIYENEDVLEAAEMGYITILEERGGILYSEDGQRVSARNASRRKAQVFPHPDYQWEFGTVDYVSGTQGWKRSFSTLMKDIEGQIEYYDDGYDSGYWWWLYVGMGEADRGQADTLEEAMEIVEQRAHEEGGVDSFEEAQRLDRETYGSRRKDVHTAQSWGYNPDAYDFFIVTNGYDEFKFDVFDEALQFYEGQDPEQEWNVEMDTSPTGITPRDFSWQLEGWNYDGDWDEYTDTLEYKSYTKEDWMQTLASANTARRSAARKSTRTATRNFTYAEQQSLQDESLGEMARNRHKLKNVDDDEADASAMFM